MRRDNPAAVSPRTGLVRRRWLLLALTAFLQIARADPIDDLVQQEMNTHRIPGVALVVVRDGRTIKTAAYGLANLELSVPVQWNTVFEIGLLTWFYRGKCEWVELLAVPQ